MHALFEDAGKFLAGRILSEADTSSQIELDSGKRVKVKAANILLKFDKPGPADLLAQAQARAAEHRPGPLAWEFAPEDDFGFADLAREYFSDTGHAGRAGGHAAGRCSRRRTTSAARARGASRRPQQKSCNRPLAAIEKKKPDPCADRCLGRRTGSGPMPGSPSASSSTKFCSAPTRTRPSTRPWSRPAAHAQQAPAAPAAGGGCHRLGLPVPLAALLARQLSQGHGLSGLPAPQPPARFAAGRCAGLLHRRFANHRDRRCPVGARAWAAGTVTLGIHIAAPGLAIQPGYDAGQAGAQPPVHRVHAGLQDHHAAR